MEIRDFARRLLSSGSLEVKLEPPPPDLTDDRPGPPERWTAPVRPPRLEFAHRRKRGKMPAIAALGDPRRRAVALHRFANHELMAFELMAFALLAWPEMPPAFRRGLLMTLEDEQRHFSMYCARMRELGLEFGDEPVNDHFWRVAPDLRTPLQYIAAMALTFENGNLDYATVYARAFREAGDLPTAALLEEVHQDEIRHVRFGVHWLRKLKRPDQTDWEAYVEALTFPNSPARARGPVFDRIAREQAQLDPDFIARLEAAVKPDAAVQPDARP
jgi:uncharacterized ferritin-like protein (DUF455 family)